MNTITQTLQAAQQAGLDRFDAQILLLHACNKSGADRAWLMAHGGDDMPAPAQTAFAQLCQRRLSGEPVAYILGQREFFGLVLNVDARVLDPRPDTETLVDWALEFLPNGTPIHADRAVRAELVQEPVTVLDLGTGSGAIALSIAKHRPQTSVTAIDASEGALQVAQANGRLLNLPVRFLLGSWFAPVQGERFDLIVSNPPYIRENDPHMAALAHEPRMALTSGDSGLDAIGHIVTHAQAHLKPGGALLLEHGYDQSAAVAALLRAAGFDDIEHRPDLAGVIRCTGAVRPAAERASV